MQHRASSLKLFTSFLISLVVIFLTWHMMDSLYPAFIEAEVTRLETVSFNGTLLKHAIPHLRSPVILTTTNSGYRELAENFLKGVLKLNLHKDIVLICEDDAVYAHFKTRSDVFVVKTEFASNITDAASFRSKQFEELVNRRVSYVLELLENGIDILYADVDAVFVQDPFPHLTGDFDLFVLDEYEIPHCPGFFFVKSTKTAIEVMKSWQRYIPGEKQNQIAYNKAIMLNNELKFTRVNRLLFIVSRFYSGGSAPWYERKPKPVVVHLNGEKGPGRKKAKFIQTKLWF